MPTKSLLLLYLQYIIWFMPSLKKKHLVCFIFYFMIFWSWMFALARTNLLQGQSITDANISLSGCLTIGYFINVETNYEGISSLTIDLDSIEGFQSGGVDLQITYTLKKGKNCIPWDGYNGKKLKIADASVANFIISAGANVKTTMQTVYLICPPKLGDDIDSTSQNLPLVVKNGKLGINDSYIGGAFQIMTNEPTAKGGTVTMSAVGAYTYIPPKNYIGFDQFTYTICYTKYPTICATAIVKIKILSTGFEAPKAIDDNYTTKVNVELAENLITNDIGGKLCRADVQNTTTSKGGKLNISTNGAFTYTPAVDFVGRDSFGYQICNAIVPQLCDSAWVYIKVILIKDIIVPSGFTPNNDGVNDFFEIQNIGMYENELKIVNRWGSIVYSATNYDNVMVRWEAKSSNNAILKNDIPEGTYFYLIDLKDGKPPTTGYVIVIK